MTANIVRFPTASLNISAASSVVATPSKLSISEALAADEFFNPISKIIGAATPPAAIAPTNQGKSVRLIPASDDCEWIRYFWPDNKNAIPRPLPKYSNEANTTESISPSKTFDIGVLAPKRIAARIA
jgi:hypothetical protein